MKKLLFILLSAICFAGYSQEIKAVPFTGEMGPLKINKVVIADETYLTYTKTGAKITTTLESVFQEISLKFGTEFQKITITYKSANGQRYKEYVILVSEATANNISQWAKKNL